MEVRFRGQTGRHILNARSSHFDPKQTFHLSSGHNDTAVTRLGCAFVRPGYQARVNSPTIAGFQSRPRSSFPSRSALSVTATTTPARARGRYRLLSRRSVRIPDQSYDGRTGV